MLLVKNVVNNLSVDNIFYCLYGNATFNLFPVAHTGRKSASRYVFFSFRGHNLNNLVDNNPLIVPHQRRFKEVGHTECFRLHRVVNRFELKGNFNIPFYVRQLPKGVKRSVSHASFFICTRLVQAIVQTEENAYGFVSQHLIIINALSPRHPCN